VRIGNPIYDVVFQYLFEDEKVARLVFSALLGKNVVELAPRPFEARKPVRRPDAINYLVLRMVFDATVQLEDGSRKRALIEIQKARDAWDVQRFRRCLSETCSDTGNVHLDSVGELQHLPILTIYFLGKGLDGIDSPVLKIQSVSCIPAGDTEKINRNCLDVATGDEVRITDPLVAELALDSLVVQIDRLKDRRRTELERLMMLFDQAQRARFTSHLLDVKEDDVPERHREVFWGLLRAGAEQRILDGMDIEDDVLATFKDQGRAIADLRLALAEKDKANKAKTGTFKEKGQSLEERERLTT